MSFSLVAGRLRAIGRRDLLGGKGAGFSVPPGFTVSTDVCTLFCNRHKVPENVEKEMETQLRRLERLSGSTLGSATNPLRVSVRIPISGADGATGGGPRRAPLRT